MRFFTLWALLVLNPRLMHQSSLQKPLRTCSDRQIWSSEKAQLRSGAAATTTPAKTMLFRMSTGLPVLVHRRLPVASSTVAPRSFTNPIEPLRDDRWKLDEIRIIDLDAKRMNLDEKFTIHFQWNLDDESWWKVHYSFSMKRGWQILMKISEFIFNEMWMENLDKKSRIHFPCNVDDKSWTHGIVNQSFLIIVHFKNCFGMMDGK